MYVAALRMAALLGVIALGSGRAVAAPIPDYNFDWAVVGAPGNRATVASEVPFDPSLRMGAVDKAFRLTRTEVTVTQWFEFVKAYAPFIGLPPGGIDSNPHFTGFWIDRSGTDANGDPTFRIVPGAEQFPADMSWRFAARYVNWLHNGKRLNRSAFETGAYDTSTFGVDANGLLTDQAVHSPGARFWIPTLDEWVKGVYYDPNKNGPGDPGYWRYPDSSDTPLIPGLPGVGETSAGLTGNVPFRFDVGSYPGTQSPWGLLDASGGEREWLEDSIGAGTRRRTKGSPSLGGHQDLIDRIDFLQSSSPLISGIGLRLASDIPAPPTGATLMLAAVVAGVRRRRRGDVMEASRR